MGDRISKSSVLSDPKIIDLLQREFNSLELNVTDMGFPDWLAGIAPWKEVYAIDPGARQAFANVAVVDSEGTYLLASGDNGKLGKTSDVFSMNYDPPRYLKMLELAVERNVRLEAARNDQSLTAEARTAAINAIRFEVQQDLERLFQIEPMFLRVVHSQKR